MGKAMTCRFNDDTMLKLKQMSEYENYAIPRSRVLRLCVAFTHELFKKLPKKSANHWASLHGDLNMKFHSGIQYHDLQD